MVEPEVQLVDVSGRPIGTTGKLAAHQPPGQLHLAISVILCDAAGRLLIQRRSPSKYHFGGLWSNSCCGHPLPGEASDVAASRRLEAELGLIVKPTDLIGVGHVTYEAADSVSGLWEREYDQVYVGRFRGALKLNPAEVAEVELAFLSDLQTRSEGEYTPWFGAVLAAAAPWMGETSQ
jgi:isopentenyl-diphosphate delta-isomerase